MSTVQVAGGASGTGTFLIVSPNSNTNRTQTLVDATGTIVVDSATQTLTNKTLTTPNIDSAPFATVSGTAPLYGCRAWVRFDGLTAGTFAGGASTVTRIVGSTTATITTTTAHGLITGNYVYAATGVVAGAYAVTVLTSTTFTITTVATTALTAASITFNFATLTASGNVNSVAKNSAGDYTINFSVAMPDASYSAVGNAGDSTNGAANTAYSVTPSGTSTTAFSAGAYRMWTKQTAALAAGNYNSVQIFR